MVTARRPGRPPFASSLADRVAKQGRLKKEVDGSPLLLDFENRTYGSRKEAKDMARAFPGIAFYAEYTRTIGAAKLERHIKYESDGVFLHGEYL